MDTGKLDFCCPECDSNEWYTIDDVAKLYGCTFCYYVTTYYHDKQKREQQQLRAVELDFCCPECNCTKWYCIGDAGDGDKLLYGCARCDCVCTFDYVDEQEQEQEQR
jgi:hypothetical protein